MENTINYSEYQEIGLINSEPVTLQDEDESSQLFKSYREYCNSLKNKNFKDIINIDLFGDMRIITERVWTNLSKQLDNQDIYVHDLLYK